MKKPWEMTVKEFFQNREVVVKAQNGGEKISRFPDGTETGIFPEIGFKRPTGGAKVSGNRMDAITWDQKGLSEKKIASLAAERHLKILLVL